MKKLYLLLLLFFALGARGQWVSIPDTNFGTWLNTHNYSACLQGNNTIGWQMDTSCPAVVGATDVNCCCSNISNLTGITYLDSLQFLRCDHNQLSSLPILPAGLTHLDCNYNLLSSLPILPAELTWFDCHHNQLSILSVLPSGLTELYCEINQLTSLPVLPAVLNVLDCEYNQLTNLPALPAGLTQLACNVNQLNNLPALPSGLIFLQCNNNQLISLPTLPVGLSILYCYNNQLNSLPNLPDWMNYCHVENNPLNCMPQLKHIVNLDFGNTNITCLPNYGSVTYSNPPLNSVPLCDVFNHGTCDILWNISGKTYYDGDSNCIKNGIDTTLSDVKVELRSGGSLVQQTFTGGEGFYSFDTDSFSTYSLNVDTSNIPFYVSCRANNLLYDTITAIDSFGYNKDFAFRCKPGFDLVAQSIFCRGFRSGRLSTVNIHAGDFSNFFGCHCVAGVSGAVTVTINGPVTYISPVGGALTPIASGNILTYNIADFGNVNFFTDFNIIVKTDTTAPIGSSVCFTVSVTPTTGDNNPANNTLTHCYIVTTSYDPNNKEVYPTSGVRYNGRRWLTYTINFQNTGTDTAQHIYVTDTLDADLDVSSFQLLAYSVDPLVQIKGNAVRFNFPNINLPDSNTNEPASHGYVQYKVKLKNNLPIGTQINNTAYIYFDFNAPVVTNTVTNFLICGVPDSTGITVTVCAGDTFYIGSTAYNVPGDYIDTLHTINGCDSLIYLTLNNAPIIDPLLVSQTICEGDSFYFNNQYLHNNGFYNATFGSVLGCDSPVTLHLTVLPAISTAIGDVFCENHPYNFNGRLITDAGLYYDTLTSITGCDSVVSLTLYIFWSDYTSVDTVIEAGNVYTLPSGSVVSTPGIYTDTLQGANGCDSIVTTTLSVVNGIDASGVDMRNVRIYPNPATNSITISISESMVGSTAIIFDITGRRIMDVPLSTTNNQLSVKDLPSGVYVAEITPKSPSAINGINKGDLNTTAVRKRWVKM